MHIGAAHRHNHMGQSPANAASAASSKRAEETRRKLFASAEELDATATAESAWMIGAWSGSGGHHGQHEKPGEENGGDASGNLSATATEASAELVIEQSAIAAAQTPGSPNTSNLSVASYASYPAPARVERAPEARQVSYWA